ncbi:ABC transporter ATP-binding protein [Termitidicoccus mucosus]|uniref:ABC transporter ATP-binding protein n=1 Tax=Termitidicoccus mucosus TaxID=1184151 RepID=A0A178IIH2_9BACT|nr:ABC transporter ATP-binding protein [Opitutaceae bacterium TSB47]
MAICAEHISKAYRIWRNPAARLKHPLLQMLGGILPRPLHPAALRRRIGDARATPYYSDFYALNDVSLTVHRGESVAIIGRNGSGKSTLLQILAGTLQPTMGSLQVNGRVAALLELGSGFNPEFTGRENVFLNASILGLTRAQTEQRFDDIAAFADIGDFIDQPVKTYSSGMMMRLAFAVIAHVDADILIVDEALAVGDVFFVQKCMRFIHDFQGRGTLLLVTHDTSAATALCQRALWLHRGESKGTGSAKDIAEKYLEATYAEKQGVVLFQDKSSRPRQKHVQVVTKDQRLKFLNESNLRNDIRIFEFDANSKAFGAGNATIENVALLDAETESPLLYCVGGESVIIQIKASAHAPLDRPIIGFFLKNKHGQILFGDNTYITYLKESLHVSVRQTIEARFQFQMPYLPTGSYTITAAIATGEESDHIQQHWLHDALAFESQSSHTSGGLIGLPMQSIHMAIHN